VIAGLAMTFTSFGWWPFYAALGGPAIVALPLPVKYRSWPLFVGLIPAIVFAVAIDFIGLFAGGHGRPLMLVHEVAAAVVIAGTLVAFDAAW
jgi:hypothetical protein